MYISVPNGRNMQAKTAAVGYCQKSQIDTEKIQKCTYSKLTEIFSKKKFSSGIRQLRILKCSKFTRKIPCIRINKIVYLIKTQKKMFLKKMRNLLCWKHRSELGKKIRKILYRVLASRQHAVTVLTRVVRILYFELVRR